ncbi:hemolysin family protein [Heliorestis convoluta]|uniref:Transporter associated domain protein n=1 Tax=Heliorestis convoluta TaxID=356322 RepID=A0A5Q2N0F3_9FIRM|nr:hemolysin family protein [Heliorestis convoluta]QGG47016.1 transporter associated domain protein [Heliorestis convoluta]
MPELGVGFKLFLVFLLIAATAFFVAAEFAVVKVRDSRIQQLINEGNKKALNAKKVTSNLDEYLSACQLGITLTALGLGWLGKPAVAVLFYPLLAQLQLTQGTISAISFVVGFSIISFLHVVVGELAPKTLAIQRAEKVTLWLSGPLILFYKALYPFIWVLNGSARILVRALGLRNISEHSESHSEEEIRMIMLQSHQSGEINQTELDFTNNVFLMTEKVVTEIMIPRPDMVCLYTNLSFEENLKIVQSEKYGRYPVCEGDKDHVVGYIHTKDLLDLCVDKSRSPSLLELIRKPLLVYEFTPLIDIMKKMQKERTQIAIVLDEYAGTAGLVTIEDILEEIVGEIQDEYDQDYSPITKLQPGHYLVDGRVSLADIAQELGIYLESEDVYTIGGWFMAHMQGPLTEGTSFEYKNNKFTVTETKSNRVMKIEIKEISENVNIDVP